MGSRVAIIGIIVEEEASVEELNKILHGYGAYIIGTEGLVIVSPVTCSWMHPVVKMPSETLI